MHGLPMVVIARWRGVPICVDITFVVVPLVLFPWRLIPELAFSDWGEILWGRRLAMWVIGVFGTFGSILLHEMAHALVARVRGVATSAIQIGCFYGLAIMPVTAALRRAMVPILAAGPLANLAIALGLWLAMGMPEVTGRLYVHLPRDVVAGGNPYVTDLWSSAFVWLFQLNVAMAIYNLLPAFPLDGGRIARIWLRRGTGEQRAVSIIAGCGAVVGAWSILGGIGLGAALITAGLLIVVYNLAIWRREIDAPDD